MSLQRCESLVRIVPAREGTGWDEYVHRHPQATNYHRWGWKQVIESSFGWPTNYLVAERDGRITGVLPLVWQKSLLFGSFITSVPFLNAGGPLADDAESERLLAHEAASFAGSVAAKYVELRCRWPHALDWPTKTSKLTVIRAVEPDSEKMFAALDKKVRSDLRKAMKSGAIAEVHGPEALDEFYPIFAENMRDLGTPVYDRRFFSEVARAFPDDTHVCVVRYQGNAVAATLLTGFRDTIEAAWSSSYRRYLSIKPNMLLYWKNICFAGERGFRTFDFGRSTVDSGTHRFKMQWGCEEIPLHWAYWLADTNALPELNPNNPKYRLAIKIWQRLPLAVTKVVGPRIVRCLP